MSIGEIFLLGAALAMDAFAVSICKGLQMKRINYKQTAVIAFFFGGFQALMPFIGWALGKSFAAYIDEYDHWIAFVLLLALGVKMIWETAREKDADNSSEGEDKRADKPLDIKELLLLAIATSIDALAAGVTFAFLEVSLPAALSIVGGVTFVICFVGVMIGNRFGAKYSKKAAYTGGAVLIFIGVKILVEAFI